METAAGRVADWLECRRTRGGVCRLRESRDLGTGVGDISGDRRKLSTAALGSVKVDLEGGELSSSAFPAPATRGAGEPARGRPDQSRRRCGRGALSASCARDLSSARARSLRVGVALGSCLALVRVDDGGGPGECRIGRGFSTRDGRGRVRRGRGRPGIGGNADARGRPGRRSAARRRGPCRDARPTRPPEPPESASAIKTRMEIVDQS